MYSDAHIAVHLFIGPKVVEETLEVSLSFFHQYLVDHG